MLIPPSIRDCVCFVYANINGEPKPVGTAFFLAVPIADKADVIVVATALHVIANIEQRSDDGKPFLRVNTRDGAYLMLPIPASAWVRSDQLDETVDVCFCPWPFPWAESPFDIRYFSAKIAATADVMAERQLGVGNDVAFAGLFVNHYGQKQNEPIVRFGNIAAVPREPVSTKYGDIDVEIEAYLIESRSVGGLSGSPVFVDPGRFRLANDEKSREWRQAGEPGGYLLGVMHGHWDARKEAAEVEVTEAAVADSFGIAKEYINMGIALVTPIDKLLKLIAESEWFGLVEKAIEHVSEPLQNSSILQLDANTGELIAKVDLTGQPPALSTGGSTEAGSPKA